MPSTLPTSPTRLSRAAPRKTRRRPGSSRSSPRGRHATASPPPTSVSSTPARARPLTRRSCADNWASGNGGHRGRVASAKFVVEPNLEPKILTAKKAGPSGNFFVLSPLDWDSGPTKLPGRRRGYYSFRRARLWGVEAARDEQGVDRPERLVGLPEVGQLA